MREVRVHRADEVGSLGQRPLEASDVGRAQPQLARTVDDLHAPVALRRQSIGDRAGAVGRVVVHDGDVRARRQREQLGHQPLDVFPFVVRRNDNSDLQNRLRL